MFEHELRFYQEIAPEVGARVPECYEAVETCDGIRLVLEGAEARAARRTLIHGDASGTANRARKRRAGGWREQRPPQHGSYDSGPAAGWLSDVRNGSPSPWPPRADFWIGVTLRNEQLRG